jgi:ABC-type spermidine/putrescine transport system permease subunit II
MGENAARSRPLVWLYVWLVLVFIYLPLLPPLVFSVATSESVAPAFTLSRYVEMWRNPVLSNAIVTSLEVGALVALIAPLLGLAAAMAIRELPTPRLILSFVLLPLFIPGVSAGLATALFFHLVGIPPSIVTIAIVQAVWALPFATLVILIAMTTFDPVYLEAAWVSGASRLRAFVDVELPLIRPGVLGAATFSLILSFNETIRTSAVQGRYNTVQTYIWATYKQIGLSPALYVLMSELIVLTLILVAALAIAGARQSPGRG